MDSRYRAKVVTCMRSLLPAAFTHVQEAEALLFRRLRVIPFSFSMTRTWNLAHHCPAVKQPLSGWLCQN